MKSKLFLIPVIALLLIGFVQSATVLGLLFFDETTGNSITITNGEQVGVGISANSVFEPMDITVYLLDASTGNLVSVLLTASTTLDSYSDHVIVGTAAYAGPGNYRIVLTVTGSTSTSTDELFLTVNPVTPANNPPVVTSTPITQVNEGAPYGYQVTATDADGDTLTYSLTQAPSWISIDSNTGLVSGTAPFVNSDTNYAVTVVVSDGIDTTTHFFPITVNNLAAINQPPVITSTPVTQVDENQSYNYQVTATDADGDTLTYFFTTAPGWLSIDPNTGLVTGTAPTVNVDENYSVIVSVSDGVDFVPQIYTLTVLNTPTPGNNPPVITSTPVTSVDETQLYNYQVTATDADGDTLTYVLTSAPGWLSIDLNTGLITGNSFAVSTDTDYLIEVLVSDGSDIDTQLYTLTVINVPSGKSGDKNKKGIVKQITDPFYEEQYLSQFEIKPAVDLNEDIKEESSKTSSWLGSVLLFLFVLTFIAAASVIIMLLRKY